MHRILIVEDNADLAFGLRNNLEIEGYETEIAGDGNQGLARARAMQPDLIILDLMLPGIDGYGVLRTLREDGDRTPVLILSARGEEVDKVRGFRLGADDYVTKPFSILELLGRVAALLRRSSPPPVDDGTDPGIQHFGHIAVDAARARVTVDGEDAGLTHREFRLLLALIERRGDVISRKDLLRTVWGHMGTVTTRTVDVHIHEIRRKLGDDAVKPRLIETVYKTGYRFLG